RRALAFGLRSHLFSVDPRRPLRKLTGSQYDRTVRSAPCGPLAQLRQTPSCGNDGRIARHRTKQLLAAKGERRMTIESYSDLFRLSHPDEFYIGGEWVRPNGQ